MAGTSPQHRIKSYIRHMAEPRISDNRALKVAEEYPGRSTASRNRFPLQKYRSIGKPVEQNPGMDESSHPNHP